jgi:predicted outer membrane protein
MVYRKLMITLIALALVVLVGCAGGAEPTPTLIPPIPRRIVETATHDPRILTAQSELATIVRAQPIPTLAP